MEWDQSKQYQMEGTCGIVTAEGKVQTGRQFCPEADLEQDYHCPGHTRTLPQKLRYKPGHAEKSEEDKSYGKPNNIRFTASLITKTESTFAILDTIILYFCRNPSNSQRNGGTKMM